MRTALTGGIASGKSSVARIWASLGAVIIDSDLLARQVVEPGSAGLAAVVERFGGQVISPDGALDRGRLGELVFADESARRDLEAIIHPAVRGRAAELERDAPAGSVVIQMIPLLVETSQQGTFDNVVVVDLDPQLQVQRLRERNGLDLEQARARVSAQADRQQRLAAATVVIHNDGTPEELERQATLVWRELFG